MPNATGSEFKIEALKPAGPGAHPEVRSPSSGPVFGRKGVVASASRLATLAGLDIMRGGGNAIDATIATSAVMAVVQPYSSHLGGDAFALIRTANGETLAVNAGGRASHNASPDDYAADGIPMRGAAAVAVPGLIDAWCTAHERLGSKPMPELLAPAIALARDGFAATRDLAGVIAGYADVLRVDPGCAEVFLNSGPLMPGDLLQQPDLARTLEAIASDGREAFYGGQTGKLVVEYLQAGGSKLDAEDFARDQAVWGKPLTISYRGWTVFEQPLPSQGFIALEALNIIEGYEPVTMLADPDIIHRGAEALRIAFYDRLAHAGDPDAVDVPIDRLLSKSYAAKQRQRIDDGQPAVTTKGGDTTSFAVADGDGTLVSFIQSVFQPWGAGVLVPGTGIMLNDRMYGFSNDPDSPNAVRPGSRTNHTLNTWLLEQEDGPVYTGGTPGADYQVQTNLQVITGIVDLGMNPQAAINAPKWALTGPGDLVLESRFPSETFEALAQRGHTIVRGADWESTLSRSQVVGRRADGVLLGASDLRAEGTALAF